MTSTRTTRSRISSLVLISAVLAACGGGDDGAAWQTFSDDAAGFAVEFPAKPVQEYLDSRRGPITMHATQIGPDHYATGTALFVDPDFSLDGEVERSVGTIGGHLRSVETISLDGVEARRFTAYGEEEGDQYVLTAIVAELASGYFLQILAVDIDGDDQSTVDQFLESASIV